MKQGPLVKFKVGLAVLILFTAVLLVVVLSQASVTKQDSMAYSKATSISNKLNNYLISKNKVPSSLSEVGVDNVPSSISYQKLSSSSYKFCVDYKATSSNFDPSAVEGDLVTAETGQDFGSSSVNSYDNSTLYISNTYHKGENCQTITPYIYSNNNYNTIY